MIRAIFIDIDDTLLDFRACSKESMRLALAEFGAEYREELYPIFERINSALWARLERHEITKAELFEVRWTAVFREAGLTLSGKEFEARFLNYLNQSAVPIEYAKEILDYLAERFPVYAASNAPHGQQCERLERAKMAPYFRDVFTSERIGAGKPSAAFFDGCFRELPGLLPENVLFIGDSLSADMKGGHDYGLRTCWLNRLREPERDGIHPDYTVFSLKEIEGILP